jgi:hypothetical protein
VGVEVDVLVLAILLFAPEYVLMYKEDETELGKDDDGDDVNAICDDDILGPDITSPLTKPTLEESPRHVN